MNKKTSSTIGQIAAISIVIETIVFAFSLVWGILFHSNFDKNLGYSASLLLAISVVILMCCFYVNIQEEYKIVGLLALAAATLYAPFCISNYFLQLSIVALNPLDLSGEVLKAIRFVPGSPTFALDMLGYGFLCLSTLAAGFAILDTRDRALRILCFLHGALALPTLAAPIISGIFRSSGGQANDIGSYILLLWCIIFTPLAILFWKLFLRNQ
jgi:hypothetical protein